MLTIPTMQVAIKLFLYSMSHKWLRVLVVRPAFLKPNGLRRVTEVNAQAGKTLKHEAQLLLTERLIALLFKSSWNQFRGRGNTQAHLSRRIFLRQEAQ